jgi:hypothetical protein
LRPAHLFSGAQRRLARFPPYHAAHAECLRGARLRCRSIFFFRPQAKVRRKASAKSGERMPRFFMSAFDSTTIFPVDVKPYEGDVRGSEVERALNLGSLRIEPRARMSRHWAYR